MHNDILFNEISGQGGNLGLITLNRPQALNALTHEMCLMLTDKLQDWAKSSSIKAVVIRGAGDRAFSAGGDVVNLYHLGQQGDVDGIRAFFRDEYRLNYFVHTYPKPFIALLDGIAMGGGVGVSIHGSHRVVTERFVFAMPETSIGFFPDIGGSYFLSRCPGETGVYLGLTGMRMNAAEAIYVELADHFVASNHLNDTIDMIAKHKFSDDAHQSVSEILQTVSVPTEPPKLAQHRTSIDRCFSADNVEDIIANLQQKDLEWNKKTLAELMQKSPTSLKVSLREIREGIVLDFSSCMSMEFRLCQRFMQGHDFYEGVRAMLIDKDKAPQWQPNTISDVTDAMVNSYFTLEEEEELSFEEQFC